MIRRECFGNAVDAAADQWQSAIGWVFGDDAVSFRDLQERADELARGFIGCGVQAGDVVAICTPNLAAFAYSFVACSKIGAILCPVNTRSKSFEFQHILSHSEAKVLILVDRFLNQDFRGIVGAICGDGAISGAGEVASPDLPALQRIVTLSEPAEPGALSWAALLDMGRTVSPEALTAVQRRQRPQNPLLLQYTSGTTGRPKGALCDHVYVLNLGVDVFSRLGVKAGEAYLNTQPFYHIGGACAAFPVPVSLGCRLVTPVYYDPETVLRLIERERCVSRGGFDSMYIMEMNLPNFEEFDLGSLRSGWCVGMPEVLERVRERMGIDQLVQLYGATEASGTSGQIDEPWELRSRSCGRPYAGVEIAILDPQTGEPCPVGTPGEITIRGWTTMIEYFKQPDETAKVINADGWVRTGDLGYVNATGHLFFVSRLKDMMKVGGENVSAEEVESVLLRHPKIKMTAVIGVPDERLQEVVMAIVELHDNASATEGEIFEFCRERMANFRVPRYVNFIDSWPMTGSGKIQKHVLRKKFAAVEPSITSKA